jgi:hypothetical protein
LPQKWGLHQKSTSCPINGGENDDEPSPEGGSANTIAIILLSISFISAIIIFIGCYALYRTDPIFVMAISLPVIIVCSIFSAIFLKNNPTRNKTRNENNKRNSHHRLYTIWATIKRFKKCFVWASANFKSTDIQKGKQGKDKENKKYKGNKDKDSANCLRHTIPPRGK